MREKDKKNLTRAVSSRFNSSLKDGFKGASPLVPPSKKRGGEIE